MQWDTFHLFTLRRIVSKYIFSQFTVSFIEKVCLKKNKTHNIKSEFV